MQFTERIVNIYIFPGVYSLQDIMNTSFHGTGAAEKGILCHLKNLFGHRSVKKDVGGNFQSCCRLFEFCNTWLCPLGHNGVVWDGKVRRLSTDPPEDDDDTFLKNIATKVVELCHDPEVDKILSSNDLEKSSFNYCHCKTGSVSLSLSLSLSQSVCVCFSLLNY